VDPQGAEVRREREVTDVDGSLFCGPCPENGRGMEWRIARLLKRGDKQRAFHELGMLRRHAGYEMGREGEKVERL